MLGYSSDWRNSVRGKVRAAACAALVLLLGACSAEQISLSHTAGPQGAEAMVIGICGQDTEFRRTGVEVAFPAHSGIEVLGVSLRSDTRAEARIRIPPDERLGPQAMVVTYGQESHLAYFDVVPQPELEISDGPDGPDGPDRLVVEVDAGANEEAVVVVQGQGSHFDPETFIAAVDVPGVEVLGVEVLSPTQAEVRVHVGPLAEAGSYPGAFSIFTDWQHFYGDFVLIKGSGITIDPTWGRQGDDNLEIDITGVGTCFDSLTTVVSFSPSGDITEVSSRVFSQTSMRVTVDIDRRAPISQYTLTVTDKYGSYDAHFDVLGRPSMVFDTRYAFPEDIVHVEAKGRYTHFEDGVTTVSVDPTGQGVNVEMDYVYDVDAALFYVDIDSSATEQRYSISLTTGSEVVTQSFRVRPTPEIESLTPSAWHQDETRLVAVSGQDTRFTASTWVEAPAGSGVTPGPFSQRDAVSGMVELEIAEDAPIGDVLLTFHNVYDQKSATATFGVLEGLPVAALSPGSVAQGAQDVQVTANGKYTHWTAETTVEAGPGCGAGITGVIFDTATSLRFHVDLGYGEPIGVCPLVITTPGAPDEVVSVDLQVASGYTTIPVGSQTTNESIDFAGDQDVFGVTLAAGEVLRARVAVDPVLYLDPVLDLLGPAGDPGAAPMAYNEDEHAATDNALIVYQAPEAGMYFLRVADRLGIETGAYTLSLAFHEPEIETETEDNDSITGADPMHSRLMRGGFHDTDTADYYEVLAAVPGNRIAAQIIAFSVSPYPTSAADAGMSFFRSDESFIAGVSAGAESPDPVLYLTASEVAFIRVSPDGGERDTTYWLNVRPQAVINEVYHDEANDWAAGFVELYGEPGMDLAGCHLVGKAYDTQPNQVFDIDLAGHVLLSSGYLVIAHDDLVPGTGAAYIDPDLVISDPASTYLSIGVVLTCNSTVLDAVCWRGSQLDDCAGTFAPDDVDHLSIGRGFHIDTDDSAQDFLPQPEPSPWSRNLREVW